MNYLSISKVIGMISKLEGSKGALSLGGKQLNMLAKDKKIAQVIGRMADPQLDVAYKAKSNYNIAAFRLRDGKEVVANGAVSLQNPGTTESIIKYRLNVGENGNILRTNGFGDFGKQLDVDDLGAAVSRRKGITSVEADSGKALRVAAELNEEEAVKLASRYSGAPVDLSKTLIYGRLSGDANKAQEVWKSIGQAVSGAPKGPKAEKAADVLTLTKLKKLLTEDFSDFVKVRKEMGKYGFQPYSRILKTKPDIKNTGDYIKNIKSSQELTLGESSIAGLENEVEFARLMKEFNIDDYIKENPSKLKLGEIEKVKKSSLGMKDEMARIKSQFRELTDEGEKARLASIYKDYTSKLEDNEKYLASLMKELEN